MSNRNRMKSNKRLISFFDWRSFHCDAVDRVRPIEHNNMNAALLACAHAEVERPNKRVIARPDVLEIDQQSIEPGEHLPGRFAMFAVQTVNGDLKSRMLVAFPFDHVVLGLTEKSVLRSEERSKLKEVAVRPLQDFRRVLAV